MGMRGVGSGVDQPRKDALCPAAPSPIHTIHSEDLSRAQMSPSSARGPWLKGLGEGAEPSPGSLGTG